MVARQQQTHRSRERQAAVAPVRREPFETAVRRNLLRQVVQIRERVQAQRIVADLHSSGVQPHVLQYCRVVLRECEVLFQNPGLFRRADDLRFREPFDLEDVFNMEYTDGQGCHRWNPKTGKIQFPEGKTWKDYVRDTRLEITCGEAPYIVSRYDTTTGEAIPIGERIGLLDRKLRVVGENTKTSGEWLEWVQEAYKSIYAYEWQGDNLLIARESMLISFIEYYQQKFGKRPLLKSINYIAYIISWNVWQMDGLKGVIPNSCGERRTVVADLFGTREEVSQCEGCQKDDIRRHNGIYCQIKDWRAKDPKTGKMGKRIRFIDLIK